MSPEDSLNIISRMMLQSRKNVLRASYYPFLVWGWATVFTSIAVYLASTLTECHHCEYLWFAIPLVGTAVVKTTGPSTKLIRTSLTSMLGHIWAMFTVLLVVISVISFFIEIRTLFLILLILSIASFTTGAIIKYPMLQYSSLAGFLLTPVIWMVGSHRQILIFAIAIMLMMIVPGYKMKQNITHERT